MTSYFVSTGFHANSQGFQVPGDRRSFSEKIFGLRKRLTHLPPSPIGSTRWSPLQRRVAAAGPSDMAGRCRRPKFALTLQGGTQWLPSSKAFPPRRSKEGITRWWIHIMRCQRPRQGGKRGPIFVTVCGVWVVRAGISQKSSLP